MEINPKLLLEPIIQLALRTGQTLLEFYRSSQDYAISLKADNSPVTAADLAAHQIIEAGLKELLPNVWVLSEEATEYAIPSETPYYWLVDPLDGTKEFIAGNGEFTVNIALVANHKPILGVVYAPIPAVCYFASSGGGAFKRTHEGLVETIHCLPLLQQLRIVVSRRYNEQMLNALQKHASVIVPMGSSLKFCMIAEGKADLYPAMNPSALWDTAAAQCIVEEAGGKVIDIKGESLRYDIQAGLMNPYFIVIGAPPYAWLTELGYIFSL